MDEDTQKLIDECYWYQYGDDLIAVRTGMPETHVRLGFGSTREEAVANLQSTPIQCVGTRYVTAALEWAVSANWLDSTDNLIDLDD